MIHINKGDDMNRPSYPLEVYELLPSLVSQLFDKRADFYSKYTWVTNPDTIRTHVGGIIRYENSEFGEASFSSFNVGRYNMKSSIWSWSWVDADNNFIDEDESNEFRMYGAQRIIEAMTKANWEATPNDIIDLMAICLKLKSALYYDIEEADGVHVYRLILDHDLV